MRLRMGVNTRRERGLQPAIRHCRNSQRRVPTGSTVIVKLGNQALAQRGRCVSPAVRWRISPKCNARSRENVSTVIPSTIQRSPRSPPTRRQTSQIALREGLVEEGWVCWRRYGQTYHFFAAFAGSFCGGRSHRVAFPWLFSSFRNRRSSGVRRSCHQSASKHCRSSSFISLFLGCFRRTTRRCCQLQSVSINCGVNTGARTRQVAKYLQRVSGHFVVTCG